MQLCLISKKKGIVISKTDRPAQRFNRLLEAKIGQHSAGLVVVLVVLTGAISYFDTLDLTAGYYYDFAKDERIDGGGPYRFWEEDWSVAFQCRDWVTSPIGGCEPPSAVGNAVFVLAAYITQGWFIFLGLFWIAKIWQLLYEFSGVFVTGESGFEIRPDETDEKFNLGLRPVGDIYNMFIGLVLIFELYVVIHRLQQVELTDRGSLSEYVALVMASAWPPSSLLRPEIYRFDTLDAGTWILLFVVALPVVVICWLALFRIRRYLIGRKESAEEEFRVAAWRAREEGGDAARALELETKRDNLARSSVWPNGDRMGQRLLALMLAFWVVALAPPLYFVLLPAAVAPELKWLIGRLGL